jgi:hypothetical protein
MLAPVLLLDSVGGFNHCQQSAGQRLHVELVGTGRLNQFAKLTPFVLLERFRFIGECAKGGIEVAWFAHCQSP